jgi:hypothetical protein
VQFSKCFALILGEELILQPPQFCNSRLKPTQNALPQAISIFTSSLALLSGAHDLLANALDALIALHAQSCRNCLVLKTRQVCVLQLSLHSLRQFINEHAKTVGHLRSDGWYLRWFN